MIGTIMNVSFTCLVLLCLATDTRAFSSSSFAISSRSSLHFRRQNFLLHDAALQLQEDFGLNGDNDLQLELIDTNEDLIASGENLKYSSIDSISSISRTVTRIIFLPFTLLFRLLFRAAASFVASFMTAVVTDPALNRALVLIVKEGANSFLTQGNVKSKIATFQETMATTSPSLAKQSGNDFLRVIIQFLDGLFSPPTRRFNREKQQTKNGATNGVNEVEGPVNKPVSS
ncbi:hypothetical protein MPSEU_000020800 [Mayamaea pseudoterrestris]|nr:hypothetical protein MPSEU_000020800 [Mayamaea pseudoterrestris]